MSIICTKCKTTNRDDALYCKECGTKLNLVNESDTSSNKSKSTMYVFIFITILVVAIVIMINSQSNDVTTEAPVAEEAAALIAEEAAIGNSMEGDPERGFDEQMRQDENVQVEEQFYIKPSGGNYQTLSIPEIRYCLAEKIKLSSIESHARTSSNLSNSKINEYNNMIQDYNYRCSEFQYRVGDLESARNDIELKRNSIEQEAIQNFFTDNKSYSENKNADETKNISEFQSESSEDIASMSDGEICEKVKHGAWTWNEAINQWECL